MPGDTVYRWQCRNHDCLHQFTTPRERPTPLLSAALSERRHPTEAEVLRMAGSDLICSKCDREFVHAKRKANHEEKCKGKSEGSGVRPTRAARRSPPPSPPAAAPAGGALIPIVNEVPKHLQGTSYGDVLGDLLRRREARARELQELNTSILFLSRQPAGAEA